MIYLGSHSHEKINFPCGETHVRILPGMSAPGYIIFEYQNDAEIIELLLVADAFKRVGVDITQLCIPYVPFSRQDRVTIPGESLSIKVFCDLINSIGAWQVEIIDPHSDVTTSLLNNCKVIEQWEVFQPELKDKNDFLLISPDGGALKKIYKLAERVNCAGVIECSKIRNVKTGEITGVQVHAKHLERRDCYIVDDICDGGRTFIEIAKVLKTLNAGKIVLMVTHGFFTKGLDVFGGLIDEIYTRKGKIK